MIVKKGYIIDGKIVLDKPLLSGAEGKRVRVEINDEKEEPFGIPDEDWPETPEEIQKLVDEMGKDEPVEWTDEEWKEIRRQKNDPVSIAKWIAALDRLPKSKWSDEDEKRWQDARAEQRAYEIANFQKWSDELKAMFDDVNADEQCLNPVIVHPAE